MVEYGVSGEEMRWLATAIALFAGLSMVSNFRFYSGKEINLRKSVPFFVILLIVLAFILVSTSPPEVLFGVFVLYGLSGYADAVWKLTHRKKPASATPPLPDQQK
jgi:CDP-diacylglycerol--serine O-phosphatidyltransferase